MQPVKVHWVPSLILTVDLTLDSRACGREVHWWPPENMARILPLGEHDDANPFYFPIFRRMPGRQRPGKSHALQRLRLLVQLLQQQRPQHRSDPNQRPSARWSRPRSRTVWGHQQFELDPAKEGFT